MPRPPQGSRGPLQGAPQGPPKPVTPPSTVILAAMPMEAVQIAARPGSASTVADLVREAMEAAEAAERNPESSYGAVREADEGFAEDDFLDFTEDIAALMEAFLSPSVAVAAQTLELTVQLALDFVDELVEKGLENRRQQQENCRSSSTAPRNLLPPLLAEDLLAALRSQPRKAVRCREALENYRQLEEFKCAFPEGRYLAAPTQAQTPAPPRGSSSSTPGAGLPQTQTPHGTSTVSMQPQGHSTPFDPSLGMQGTPEQPLVAMFGEDTSKSAQQKNAYQIVVGTSARDFDEEEQDYTDPQALCLSFEAMGGRVARL
ncbi:hypothetical protein cyc_02228 [Cyclospora cayetanensis]|uniref:Uncharacterized protein n=1 Tax=Cyclospora cayetanensis TaxID=88456 RepID=A0A1D3D8S8_9EIME|nr:hypothetical protein cyc_02228 [Cyclospora cayetanensis]